MTLISASIAILLPLGLRNVLHAEHGGRQREGLDRAGRGPVQGEDLDLAACALLPAPNLGQRPERPSGGTTGAEAELSSCPPSDLSQTSTCH